MAWKRRIQVGRVGEERAIDAPVIAPPDLTAREIEHVHKNLQGDILRSVVKINTPIFALSLAQVTEADVNYLIGLKSRARNLLSLILNDGWTMPDEENTTTDTTHVTLINTSARGITVTGVFLDSDFQHTGTNFFTSGSFDATTRIVTLGAAVPSANTNVLIAYTFTKHRVFLRSMRYRPMPGAASARFYYVDLEFEGA